MHIYCSFPHALKKFLKHPQCCSLPMLAVFTSWKKSASFPIAVRNRAKQGKNPTLLCHIGFISCHIRSMWLTAFKIKDQKQVPDWRHLYITRNVFNQSALGKVPRTFLGWLCEIKVFGCCLQKACQVHTTNKDQAGGLHRHLFLSWLASLLNIFK